MREASRFGHGIDPAAALRVEQSIEYWRHARLPHSNRRYEVPMAEVESFRARLEADQAAWLHDFDQAVSEARPVLLGLAEAGETDLVWVLGQILRCTDARSGEVPRPRSLTFSLKDFQPAVFSPTGAHMPDGALVLTARKTLRGGPPRRRARGPGEMINSIKMAMLARRFRETTRSPRYEQIAGLFRAFARMIWGRPYTYLGEDHIRQRVIRVKRQYPDELRRQIDFGERFRKAWQDDRMFAARGGGPGSRTYPPSTHHEAEEQNRSTRGRAW